MPYYHVVFTLPAELNELCRFNQRTLYDLLFQSAWRTLQVFSADEKWLGAKSGATMVLHTWGQNLMLHPPQPVPMHIGIHCIVPGGGLDAEGNWKNVPYKKKFLFPVKAMSSVFRAMFLKQLWKIIHTEGFVMPEGFPKQGSLNPWRQQLYQKPWVVYAKRPFGGPEQVVEYLGRYTHKTAISNHRILSVDDHGVQFRYKDYRTGGKIRQMTLDGVEFLRRFSQHILPPCFRRMRHYGILSNACKKKALTACRKSLAVAIPDLETLSRQEQKIKALLKLTGRKPGQCPHCTDGQMVKAGILPPQRAPPKDALPLWFAIEPC